MAKTKIIYSLKVHIQLQKMGISYEIEMENPKNHNLRCWVYSVTPEFEKALDRIWGGKNYGDR